MARRIYLDNQSTTRVDDRVIEAMLPFFREHFGNAASRNHPFGWEAEEAVGVARRQVADILGAKSKEVIFTSGATESNNLALKGAARMYREKGDHIITAATEHKCVIDSVKGLERDGFQVSFLPVAPDGLIDPEDVARAITDRTVLVSVMHANNEIGVIQDIAAIGAICRARGVLFHTDATQAIGKIPFDVEGLNVDLASLSAHKLYGPKGVGALYVRGRNPRVRLSPILDGGGHERGMRSGTLNVPGIVGFGMACEIARAEMAEEGERILGLRRRLWTGLQAGLDELHLNGHPERRLPGNLNVSFAYVEGESLLMGINREIAVSSGSACTSASLEPSYVLRAIGVGDDLAHSSIRFGIGRFNTEEEIEITRDRIVATVLRLRELSPLYEMAKAGIDLKTVQWGQQH